ncbi:FtsB family cell division protein [Rothia sp. P6271]|uniref:FtsB family cell division protein n=1 Tax=unclassified Rothia (in: high G+C Gram-positive bacteria) TaxID=2689056 RepID=UPI003AD1705C
MSQENKPRRRSWANFFGTEKYQNYQDVNAREDSDAPVAAHAFSGRLVAPLIIFAVILISSYAPVSTYIRQQSEIHQVESHIDALQQNHDSLQTQLSWWQDENYVKQQAKSRLYYMAEGETPYLVVGVDPSSHRADDTSAAAQSAPKESWTKGLWSSFEQSAFAQDPTHQKPANNTSEPAHITSAEEIAPADPSRPVIDPTAPTTAPASSAPAP